MIMKVSGSVLVTGDRTGRKVIRGLGSQSSTRIARIHEFDQSEVKKGTLVGI